MDLGEAWTWDTRKLACKIRSESGNPGVDELRQRLSDMSGVPVPDYSASGASKLKRHDKHDGASSVRKSRAVRPDLDAPSALEDLPSAAGPKKPLARLGTSTKLVSEFDDRRTPANQMNINKKFFVVPRSPPARIIADIHREKLYAGELTDDGLKPVDNTSKNKLERRRRERADRARVGKTRKTSPIVGEDQEEADIKDAAATVGSVFRPYKGDVFATRGSYMGGMVYLSRFADHPPNSEKGGAAQQQPPPQQPPPPQSQQQPPGPAAQPAAAQQPPPPSQERSDLLDPAPDPLDPQATAQQQSGQLQLEARGSGKLAASGKSKGGRGRALEDEDELTGEGGGGVDGAARAEQQPQQLQQPPGADGDSLKAREAKLHCAATLASWAQHDANTVRLAREGAVQATMILCKEDDVEIRKHCAHAFKHMSSKLQLCEQLIQGGAVQTILELFSSAAEEAISRDCAVCLVNMTRMDGIEAKLVEDGIVLALMTLMNKHEELSPLCVRGLFNLTCVDHNFLYVERVIKAFVQLAATNDVKHVCVSGLCNLSDLKPIRPRIVEEGVVQALIGLSRQAEPKTRRVCAIILHSLALSPVCRGDMVAKGAVLVLHQLSSDEDSITLHYIASAIIRLAMDQGQMHKLIADRGVLSLCNICHRCPTIASTTQLCAAALQVLSQRTIDGPSIVQEGVVPALVTLLRDSKDPVTLRHGLAALCNLLTSAENHLSIITQHGIDSVISLCNHDDHGIREACALALFNLSRGNTCREHPVQASAIPAIIQLSRLKSPVTQMRCAAALCKLASIPDNVPLMLSEGVVPAFIDMLKTEDPGIVKHCCSALCSLAHEGSSCVMITEGAVPFIINGAQTGDATTQQACCAVLSIISSHEQCRRKLVDMGALPALIQLAQMNDMKTRLRCAVAFANLSFESTIQGQMVDHDIAPVIDDLSSPSPTIEGKIPLDRNLDSDEGERVVSTDHDSSYSEENQLFCAKALCNLGCHIGSEAKIVAQGGAYTLMMICMLRAGRQLTKQVCAKALLNLLTPDTLKQLVDGDLVQATSSLSRRPPPPKNDDETLLRVCALIFCNLSSTEYGRAMLVEKPATLVNIFNLMRSKEQATQVICGKTACNLLSYEDSQARAVDAGAVLVLKQMCTLGDPASERDCANAFFLISGEEHYRRQVVHAEVLPVLILLARSRNRETRWSCNRILCNLALHESTRVALLAAGTVPAMVALARECDAGDAILDICMYTLAYLAQHASSQRQMVDDEVVLAIGTIWASRQSSGPVAKLAALTLRSLSECEAARRRMMAHGSVALLAELVGHARAADPSPLADAEEVYVLAAATTYNFSCCADCAELLVEQGVLASLVLLGQQSRACAGLVAGSLYLLSQPSANREKLVDFAGLPALLLRMAESREHPPIDDGGNALKNCAGTLFVLSKAHKRVQEKLVEAGVVPMLIRLSKSELEKVRTTASEALKNLSSSGSDGIEEGTVSTLISMTLSGSAEQALAAMDEISEHERPAVAQPDLSRFALPDHLLPHFDSAFEPHVTTVMKLVGGGAGHGPAPPEPPAMETADDAEIALEDEDGTDMAGEDEEQTDKIMMFAKMDVPENFLQ